MTRGRTARPRAKRSLSQNFLVDPNIQRKIVAELDPQPGDTVLEVGPGRGELSEHVLGRCRRLVVVEKDRDLARALAERWKGRPDANVIEGDALRIDLSAVSATAPPPATPPVAGSSAGSPLRVLSNVPYNITSPLVFAFLDLEPAPVRIVITVQREVAERIVASPGTGAYGALSVGIQSVADVALPFRIGRQAFRPVPSVDSAVVRLTPRPEAAAVDRTALRRLTRACFSRRRKQLQKILRTAPELATGDATDVLGELSIDRTARPESLDPATFVALSARLERLRPRSAAH